MASVLPSERTGLLLPGQIRGGLAPRHFAAPDGLMGYWPCDYDSTDFTNNIINDVTGNGLNGTLNNSISSLPGPLGTQLGFNGTSTYVSVANSSLLNFTKGMSFSAWVKLSVSPANTYYFVGKKGILDSTSQYALTIDGPDNGGTPRFTFFIWVATVAKPIAATNTTITSGIIYHVVGTYDGATLKIYVNGKLDNSVAQSGDIDSASGIFYMGRNNSTAAPLYWQGGNREIRLYNHAIDPAKVAQLYQAGLNISRFSKLSSRHEMAMLGIVSADVLMPQIWM